MHIFYSVGNLYFTQKTTLEAFINCIFFFHYSAAIRGHLNYLQVVNISIGKAMYRTNTKNSNNKMSWFKAQFFIRKHSCWFQGPKVMTKLFQELLNEITISALSLFHQRFWMITVFCTWNSWPTSKLNYTIYTHPTKLKYPK